MNYDAIFSSILDSMGYFQPELVLGGGFLALLIIDLFLKKEHSPIIAILALVVLTYALV
jgi:hypothetical protein